MSVITARILQSTGLSANIASMAAREFGLTSDTERPVIGTTVAGTKYVGTEQYTLINTVAPAALAIQRRSMSVILCDTATAGASIALDVQAGAQAAGYQALILVDGPGTRDCAVTYGSGLTETVLDGSFIVLVWQGTKWIKTGVINSPTADEKAALAGTYGTPSATNPYITSDDEPNLAVLSATKLATARAINGVAFDGTAPITIQTAPNVLAGTNIIAADIAVPVNGAAPSPSMSWAIQSTTSTSYAKVWEWTSTVVGTITVTFAIYAVTSGTAYGRVYLDAVATGTERSSSSTTNMSSYSQTFTVAEGTKVQIYAKHSVGGGSSTQILGASVSTA